MEPKDYHDQDQIFQHNYDDEHDSDVEARLYAEVYYSNTIIGEENNTDNSAFKNQCPNAVNDFDKSNCNNHDLLHEKNITQNKSINNITCNKNLTMLNDSSVNTKTTKSTKESNTRSTNNFLKESVSTHKINNLSNIINTPNSKKRTSNKCLDDVNKSSKKQKHTNQNDIKESQSSHFKEPFSELRSNQGKTFHRDACALVNPYNKNVMGNEQNSMKLLSPEFINIFFTGRSRKKKKKDHTFKKDKSKRTSNIIPDTEIIEQSSNMTQVENNLENDISSNSPIINISSESSNESFQDNSKYNTIVATDKKLKDREFGFKNTDKTDMSDSEESIFEVPVPPKPAPLIVEVEDSDNEQENQSDKDNFLNDSVISQEIIVESDHEISLDSTLNETQDTCEIISDNDDFNSLILNCTEVQKGVSNLNEIKKLHQQKFIPIETNSDTSSSNIQHSQNMSSNNSIAIEKTCTSLKSKPISKSSSKNISLAEYFFQPMNEKMKSFYNDSWGGEHFDMNRMKSNMSTDPNKWAILNKDLVITGPRKKRYFGMTCPRCHKDGHRLNNCPEPNKGPICHMCGANGHFATHCPHTKCLTCGRQQTMYRTTCAFCEKLFCTRCRSQGHKIDTCPDLWRRYHHTTNSLAPKIPLNVKNVMKSKHELFCCNCTKQGHDSLACKKLRWSQHFPNPSFVTHYNGPTYTVTTNSNALLIVDDIQDNPYKKHNSGTSNTVTTNFPRSGRRNENSVQSIVDDPFSGNNTNNKIIFNICKMNIKLSGDRKSKKNAIKNVILQLNVPDKNNPGSVEKWKKLTDFLQSFGYDLSSEFRLEQKDKQLLLYIKSPRKYMESLSNLIKQYSSRSNYERSQMLLNTNRNVNAIIEHLSLKFTEMKNVTEDISMLYEKTRRLREEVFECDPTQNETHNRLKLNDLVLSQQKLVMLLYREGFADGSLGQLRKIFLKMQKRTEQIFYSRKIKKNNKYAIGVRLVSFKSLFIYLHYYNNIFVPYELRKLDSYIEKYRENVERRNKLLNNSLIFPQETDKIQNKSNEKPVQESLSRANSETTSQELSIVQNSVIETPADFVSNNYKLNLESPNQTLVSSKQKTDKKLNLLYYQAMHAEDHKRKSDLLQNFKNFIKNTRNCLEQASKLNSPQLHDDIVALRRELEDEIHLSTSKVRKFKKKLHQERLKLLQSITKKQKKKHRTTPNNANDADNIYKKFCASL
ncbi:uncharacterized protein LOC131668924 [Phymastichus coffea]|uniref:uncharacterized protein LOC131668924 n=1 Tax=Phymastichus coffea TaxID=108790 RepID=UPI00273AD11E|nr:uncharacterized protein LOC131668924 [Phymastichus coffea]